MPTHGINGILKIPWNENVINFNVVEVFCAPVSNLFCNDYSPSITGVFFRVVDVNMLDYNCHFDGQNENVIMFSL